MKVALTIAGVDSSGGAGVVADVAAIAAQGVWPACAVTAVTAQNTRGVDAIELLSPDIVEAQIAAVCSDLAVGAVKTGMLGSADIAAVVATSLPSGVPLVVDPVMVASTGATLMLTGLSRSGRDKPVTVAFAALVARAELVTPNAAEAEALTGIEVGDDDAMVQAARALVRDGAKAALVKGGHVGTGPARDCLVVGGQPGPVWLESPRVASDDTHGTGCVLSASIAAGLALGDDLVAACQRGKAAVTRAIEQRVWIGGGVPAANPR